jgi:S-adenosylmethionine-dependent methyltransferase
MTDIANAFNQGMDLWKENQDAPWGKLRYKLVLANLALHLTKPNQTILDVGGGNGVESILLAQQGHQITLVDFSHEMLDAARTTIARLHLSSQVTLQQADVVDLP